MIKLLPGQIVRFTYNHKVIDEFTGDKFKEVFVLNPNWLGKLHAIDLKRITPAERAVLVTVFDPKSQKKSFISNLSLVNDILRRMNPIVEAKNPLSFYHKFVKPFLKRKDAYRQYFLTSIVNPSIVKKTSIKGNVTNPNPLFHKVETKAPVDAKRAELIRKVAAEKGVGISAKSPLFKKV